MIACSIKEKLKVVLAISVECERQNLRIYGERLIDFMRELDFKGAESWFWNLKKEIRACVYIYIYILVKLYILFY